eukprot:TRINITY_DN2985_c1_g2_i3.p1 TRINITY_DN2985_c1_g2~~TRINITY_DN2985_c1_g2_i3.p1  ORF type:complete len:599 (+),score=134.14 TRINITY_DN2985_c1_g2_i3:190-1986(+)
MNHVKNLYAPARERGIQEGMNGYRSIILVVLRVLEKIGVLIDECPLRRNGVFAYLGSSDPKKWNASMSVFVNQLGILGTMTALCSQISETTHDIFVDGYGQTEQEQATLNLALKLPTFCFFGTHFGSQFDPSVGMIMKVIMIASTSYTAAKDHGKSDHWMMRGTKSLAYGAYYKFNPNQAAERFVQTRLNANIHELKDFWSLTENSLSEKATSFTINVAQDIKLTLPGKPFGYRNAQGLVKVIFPPGDPAQGKECYLDVAVRYMSYHHYATDLEEVSRARHSLRHSTGSNRSFFSRGRPDIKPQQSQDGPPIETPLSPDVNTSTPDVAQERHSVHHKSPRLSDSLIIYIHGGGFVAHTSSSHLKHIKKWTKDTGVPIVSIEYRLAPEFCFPTQFEECYFAYMWIINNCHRFGTTGRNVVVIGDSAGGNLVAAVTLMAISQQTRVPDGMILVYPATHMHFVPSPSRILSAIDPLLPTIFLRECFNAYLPPNSGIDPMGNPYLSPSNATDDLLKQLPMTYMMVGTLDPLLDDTIHFAKRCCLAGKQVRLKIYDGFPHGFLNLGAVPNYGREMWMAVKQCSEWMKEVFLREHQRPLLARSV